MSNPKPLLLAVCLALVALTSLPGCGDDEELAAAPKLDTPKLASIEALTPGQYTAIKKVYVAALPLDKIEDGTSVAEVRAVVKPVLAACDDLPTGDPLLGALRLSCPATSEFVEAAADAADCSGDDECADAFAEVRKKLSRASDSGRVGDRAVTATDLPNACKRALVTSEEAYEQAMQLRRALGLLQKSLENDDEEQGVAGLAALGEIDEDAGPTAQQMLDRLRRNCH